MTDDLDTLFELAREGENVQPRYRARHEDATRELLERLETAMLLSGENDRPQRHRHDSSRRGRHGEPGLGRDAAAHVPALGGAREVPDRDDGPPGRRRRGHQIGHLRSERRERLRAAAIGDRRAPAGAHFAVRRQRAAAHVVRVASSSIRRSTTRSRSISGWTICASIRSARRARAGSTST